MKCDARLIGSVICLAALCLPTIAFAGLYGEHLTQIPGDANVLILVNAAQAKNSTFAQRVRKESPETVQLNRSLYTSPNVERVVMASKFDFQSRLPVWELAIVSTKTEPNLKKLSQFLGGNLDTLDGLASIQLPIDAYIVMLKPKLAGIMAPGDRQAVSRWIRRSKATNDIAISDYLKKMAVFPEEAGTDVIMAMDLTDVVSSAKAQAYLADSKAVAGKDIDTQKLGYLLASVRGATLGVKIRKRPVGALRIDFGQDAAVMTPVAKPLILEILSKLGAKIDEFSDWNVKVKGNTVFMEGVFTISGLRRVMTLAEPPLPPLDEQSTQTATATSTQKDAKATGEADLSSSVAQASYNYFKSISSLLEEVSPRRRRGKSAGEYGIWLNRYARKIDKLPILNVDKDLLDYSMFVSHKLREISNQYRGIGVRTAPYSSERAQRTTFYGESNGYYRGYSYWYNEPYGLTEKQIARKQATTKAVSSGMNAFDELDNATIQIRRLMTERYKVEFK